MLPGLSGLIHTRRTTVEPGETFFVPKRKLSYDRAVERFERRVLERATRVEAKEATIRAERREARRQRQDAARLVKITHLRKALTRAALYPSLMTAKQLGAIAKNPELPAEARVEAARLLQQWLFAEPAELTPDPQVHNGNRRRRSPG